MSKEGNGAIIATIAIAGIILTYFSFLYYNYFIINIRQVTSYILIIIIVPLVIFIFLVAHTGSADDG